MNTKLSFTTHLVLATLSLLALSVVISGFFGLVFVAGVVADTHGIVAGISWWAVALILLIAVIIHVGDLASGN